MSGSTALARGGPAPQTRRTVFREASFLRLWEGTTASGLATWAMPFILGLAVLDDTITPTGPGLVLATRTDGSSSRYPSAGSWPIAAPVVGPWR